MRIAAELHPWGRTIDLFAGREEGDQLQAVAPVQLVTQPSGHRVAPFITLQLTAAQQLMDELWRCGLRPSEGSGSSGALAATERHLADMRSLVFKEKPAR